MRITLKKANADGTIAIDMDPLSLLCRLATSAPPPRRHTVRYSGVLAPASPWRRGLVPMAPSETPADGQRPRRPEGAPLLPPLGGAPGAPCITYALRGRSSVVESRSDLADKGEPSSVVNGEEKGSKTLPRSALVHLLLPGP